MLPLPPGLGDDVRIDTRLLEAVARPSLPPMPRGGYEARRRFAEMGTTMLADHAHKVEEGHARGGALATLEAWWAAAWLRHPQPAEAPGQRCR